MKTITFQSQFVFFHNLQNVSMFTSKYERSNVEVTSITAFHRVANSFCKRPFQARWRCVSNAGSIKRIFHRVAI